MIDALGAGLLSFGGAAAAATRRIRAIEVEMATARNVYDSQAKHAKDHGVRSRLAERAVESAAAAISRRRREEEPRRADRLDVAGVQLRLAQGLTAKLIA